MSVFPSLGQVLGEPHYAAGLLPVIAEELGEMVDVFERDGLGYARRCLEGVRSGGRAPQKPRDMHPMVAKAIREVVMDHALYARHTAGRR